MASTGFLSEFPPVANEEWERAIRESVAGPEYAAKLIWHAEEGLAVKPYYRADDVRDLEFMRAAPGSFPFVRGTRATAGWRIREEIEAAGAEEANRAALDAVAGGAEEIAFRGVTIQTEADVALLLANLREIPIRLEGLSQESAHIFTQWFCCHPHDAPVSADIDPLVDIKFSEELCRGAAELRFLTISAERYEEMGLGATEQIALVLAAGVEFLQEMLELGVGVEEATRALGISFAVGPRFYVEIAKLRAFRLAWARMVEVLGGTAESGRAVVHTGTAHWNQTVYDSEVNLLRAATEAMSAVLGGADSVAAIPFDWCYRRPDEGSRRISRNLQNILKREAGLERVADPLGGAWLIESLTGKIASRAWKLFQEIEAAGGYRKAKADGIIASIIERRAEERQRSASQRRLVLTGTNRFANARESALDRIDGRRQQAVSRAARMFEELRLRTERAARLGKLPKIVLAQFGDRKMRALRAQFAADFLACAGLSADVLICNSPAEITQGGADFLVLCSSDAEYLPFCEELMGCWKQRDRRAEVAIAGNPDSAERLKQLGVAHFLHLRSNAVEVLVAVQQKLGIEG